MSDDIRRHSMAAAGRSFPYAGDTDREDEDDEEGEEGTDDGAFVQRRNRDRRTQSILPHQNFLSPRRPGAGPIMVDTPNNGNSAGPLSRSSGSFAPADNNNGPRPSSSMSRRTPSPIPAYLYRPSEDAQRAMNDTSQQAAPAIRHAGNSGFLGSRGEPQPITQRSSSETLATSSAQHQGAIGVHAPGTQRSQLAPGGTMTMNTASREPLLPATRLNGTVTSYPQDDGARATSKREDRVAAPVPRRSATTQRGSVEAKSSASARTRARPQSPSSHPRLDYLWSRIRSPVGNPFAFLGSFALLLILGGLWMGFEASYLWYHLSPAVPIVIGYVWLAAIINMLVTAYTDPGTVPKDLDPDPPTNSPRRGGTSNGNATPADHERDPEDPLYSPLPRIIRVRNGQDLTLKWCETCHVYRPPRSSHCRVCDICVDGIDHHCTFLNTCIGRRNYTPFFAFLIFSLLTAILCIVFSAIRLKLLTTQQGYDFQEALQHSPMSAVLFLLILIVFIPILTLFSYHLRLIMMGRTTVEQIRINTQKAHSYEAKRPLAERMAIRWKLGTPGVDPNPFAYRDPCRNCAVVLCRPGVATSVAMVERRAGTEGKVG